MSSKLRAALIALAVAFPLDQLTKLWVVANVPQGERVPLLGDLFYLTHVRNPGAAFGLFLDATPGWRAAVFIGVSVVAIVVMLSYFQRLAPGDRVNAGALGLILAGTLGNLSDRLWRQEVVDFLHLRLWQGYTWPDFNVADACIVMGVTVLVMDLLASEAAERAGPRR